MYTLQKAKQEIDEIAKHAMDIAAHAISMGEHFDSKLDAFKKDIIGTIEAKFAELEKTMLGDTHMDDSTALADLGAKVSLLVHGAPQHPTYNDHHEDQHSSHDGDHYQSQDQHDQNHNYNQQY